MTALRLKPVRVSVPNPGPLVANAAALARGGSAAEDRSAHLERVGFHLGEHRCALDLALVTRAVTRLGEVVPLLGASERIKGIAFIDNVPHAVADLCDALDRGPRSVSQLRGAPALVVARDGWRVAVAVDSPLDLVEGDLQLLAADSVQVGGVALAGRERSGALVVSPAWFNGWLEQLASVR